MNLRINGVTPEATLKLVELKPEVIEGLKQSDGTFLYNVCFDDRHIYITCVADMCNITELKKYRTEWDTGIRVTISIKDFSDIIIK